MRGDVDEVPGLPPGAHDLDGARIGLGGQDLLVAVGLLDAGADLLRPQPVERIEKAGHAAAGAVIKILPLPQVGGVASTQPASSFSLGSR